MWDYVSHPYKTTCKVVALHVLIFKFLDSRAGRTEQQQTPPEFNLNVCMFWCCRFKSQSCSTYEHATFPNKEQLIMKQTNRHKYTDFIWIFARGFTETLTCNDNVWAASAGVGVGMWAGQSTWPDPTPLEGERKRRCKIWRGGGLFHYYFESQPYKWKHVPNL